MFKIMSIGFLADISLRNHFLLTKRMTERTLGIKRSEA